MRLLWGVAHALDRTSKRMNQALGVTGPQRLVLAPPHSDLGAMTEALCPYESP